MMAGVSGGGNLADAATQPGGSGTAEAPYRISSSDEWDYFQTMTSDNAGKYFMLTADISVSTMFAYNGDDDGDDTTDDASDNGGKPFSGIFDGNGHTLTFKKGTNASPETGKYCAPFRYVKGATIKNLKIEGEIYVDEKFAAGIVGCVKRSDTEILKIQNCICSLTIRSTKEGDSSHGGLVGKIRTNVEIKNCIFNGQLLGSTSHSNSGFVAIDQGALGESYPTFTNCVFEPSSVNFDSTSSNTFTRCNPTSTTISYNSCYYKKTLGVAQGTDVSGMTDSELKTSTTLNDDDDWVLHAGTLYLKPLQRWVDIIGWKSGGDHNEPVLTGNRADNNSDRYVTYTYYKVGESEGSEDYPTTKGHYTVKASVPGGVKRLNYPNYYINHTWSAWESTMNFCVYDAPVEIERDYDPNNSALLANNGSVDADTIYYRYKKDDGSFSSWSVDVPSATDIGTYTIEYYIKGNETHNDIGSTSSPAGSVTSKIKNKTVSEEGLIITLSPSSYTYDNTAKTPEVTVKDGENTIDAAEYECSYVNNTNAGTATVTITDKPGGNYDFAQTTKTFSIEKEQLTVTVAAKTLTYSGEAQELVSGSLSGTNISDCSIKYSTDGVNYTTTIPKGTEAKAYTVYYKVEGDSNHNGTDAATAEVTISAKTVSSPTVYVSPSSFTYDGSEKMPDVTVYDGDTEIDGSEYSVSYSDNTNAGTATVTITDNEGGNYNVSGSANFSIVSEGSTYTPPTAKTGLVYNGTEQELLTAGSTTTGTMQYSSDGKTYNTDIPKGTDAGTYTLYYMVKGDDNHNDTSPVSVNVTISEKTVSNPLITVTPSSYYYDGTAKKPSVTVKDGETEISSSEYTVGYTDNKNIGTATVIVSDNEGGNYRVSGTANFSILNPEEGETPMAKSGLVYNGSAQELITSGKAVEGNTMVYSLDGTNYSSTIPTGTNAKTYTVYFKEIDADNKDVTSAISLKATISPKTISITVTVSDNGAYKPTLTVTDSEGNKLSSDDYTVTFRNAAGKEIDASTSVLQSGNYTVTVKPKGNYTGSSITKSFRVLDTVSFVFTMESDLMTVCLPFSREVPSGYHLYYFDRVNDEGRPVFKRILTKKMTAGKSYLLKYVGSSASTRAPRTVDLSPSNLALVDFSTTIETEYYDGMLMKGTFEDLTSAKCHMEGFYVLRSDNKWVNPDDEGADEIGLEAFHSYLRYEDRSVPVSPLSMVMMSTTDTDLIETTDPDGLSGLNDIELDETVEQWYDLQGRRLDTPQRGVNIIRKSDGTIMKVVKR